MQLATFTGLEAQVLGCSLCPGAPLLDHLHLHTWKVQPVPLVCFHLPAASSAASTSRRMPIFCSVTQSSLSRVSPVFLRELSFRCCSHGANRPLWARHWPPHDHMFLLCHQPKDQSQSCCSLRDKAEISLQPRDLFNLLLHHQSVRSLHIDCSVH